MAPLAAAREAGAWPAWAVDAFPTTSRVLGGARVAGASQACEVLVLLVLYTDNSGGGEPLVLPGLCTHVCTLSGSQMDTFPLSTFWTLAT